MQAVIEKMLNDFEQRQREKGITVWMAGLNPGVSAIILPSPLGQLLGPERLFYNLEQVVTRYGLNVQTATTLIPDKPGTGFPPPTTQ